MLKRIRNADERTLDHELEPLRQSLINKLIEQRKVLFAVLQRVSRHVLDERFTQVHVPGQIAERHFRLDHPKLGGVSRGVRIFGAKGRAKRVDVGKGAGKRLALELAADGQISLSAKEIRLRFFIDVTLEGRDPEHLTGALAIARGDDRRVHVNKIALLEKLMHGKSQAAAGSEHGPEQVRPRTQVSDRTQKLGRMALLLQRIRGVGGPNQL